ncbi:uncharacterized protein NPIL_79801 [Nephila pilipes]|uniref:Cyclin N-terminal domain-containing protein n=1 Tax=Nephila pilipes TaxID=299642 RepID=A0A8X6P0Q5_NEPPI|nr:uncharacterized protein NPIL_79801 [Nephila pilipes]
MSDSDVSGLTNDFSNCKMNVSSDLQISEGALVIQEYGSIIGCPMTTVAKALVLYHRFQRLVEGHEDDLICVPAAVLNISIQLCDDDIKAEKIVLVFYHKNMDKKVHEDSNREDPPADKIKQMIKSLIKVVYFVCRVLSFTLDCEIAHKYVFGYLSKFQHVAKFSDSEIVGFSTTAAKLLSTFYLCQRCIQYEPQAISAACMFFLYEYFDMNISKLLPIMNKEFGEYAEPEKVWNILDDMLSVSLISTKIALAV